MTDGPDDPGLVFDAANALNTLLAELIVELVKSGALSRTQAAKILLRAEGFIDALRFQKEPEDSLAAHQLRLDLLRSPVESVLGHVERRLALRPDVYALRRRRRIVAEGYRRRRVEDREYLEWVEREARRLLDELDRDDDLD